LLSVSDLDRALNANAPLSIDPHRQFQMRDLVVLYLAYLLAAIDEALEADAGLTVEGMSRRYAAPAWRGADSAGIHGSIVRWFGEADAFRAAAGAKLLSPGGMTIPSVTRLLPKATQDPSHLDMGLIFEAPAAAAYTSIGLKDSASHLIVVDMGAGTTDIAALARVGGNMFELPEARVTLKQAGDFIDKVIANRVLDANAWAKSKAQQADLWAVLMRHMRDIKETIFAEGRATLRHEGRNIAISLRDIERDADFREFMETLTEAYETGLAITRGDARARKGKLVDAVAVGGGAAAPFIQDMIRAKPRGGGPRVEVRPATPDWARGREWQGNLAPVFPQLAIAIGGALAPEGMLAARAATTPAAPGRNGIPAERD
jgi:hypothetical protein